MFEGFDTPENYEEEEEEEEEVSPPRISQFGQLLTNFDSLTPTEEEYEQALLERNPLPVLGGPTASRRHRYGNQDQENQPPSRKYQGFQGLRDSKHLRLKQQAIMGKASKKKPAVASTTETRAQKAARQKQQNAKASQNAAGDGGTGATSLPDLSSIDPKALQAILLLAGQNGINLGQVPDENVPPAKKLKAVIAKKKEERSKGNWSAMKMPKGGDLVKKIKAFYWTHYFRNLKFIDSQQHLDKTVEKFYTKMGLEEEYSDPNYMASWCLTYKGTVNTAVTEKRSYIQQEMKKAVWGWLNSDEDWLAANPLPTDDEICACAY